MLDRTKKSFIINEGLRIRDQHEIVMDFMTLDQPINQLSGDAKSFLYSLVFATAMMVLGKFLFSIYLPSILEVIALLVFSLAVVVGLSKVLVLYNTAVRQYTFSTMGMYLGIGLIVLTVVGLF